MATLAGEVTRLLIRDSQCRYVKRRLDGAQQDNLCRVYKGTDDLLIDGSGSACERSEIDRFPALIQTPVFSVHSSQGLINALQPPWNSPCYHMESALLLPLSYRLHLPYIGLLLLYLSDHRRLSQPAGARPYRLQLTFVWTLLVINWANFLRRNSP